MADRSRDERNGGDGTQRRDWATEAEEALDGVGIALREAWEASREARLSALESAKKAALQLGDAIDLGVAAARQKWEEAQPESPEEATTLGEPRAVQGARMPKMGPDDGRTEEE